MGTRREQGFTLIELMISVVILGIVTSQMMMVFTTQKKVFSANQRVLDVQEDARLLMDLITFDARNAGFMVPTIAAVASSDGGAAGADRICISDSGYFDFPLPGGPASVLDSRDDHYDDSRLTSFTDDFTFQLSTLDIDSSGMPNNVDFQSGSGVIVSNGELSACARISAVDTTNRILNTAQAIDSNAFITHPNGLLAIRVVPAVVYELNGTNLTRNGLLIASSVEDLQVEFWVDNIAQNGQVDNDEFPIHDLNAPPVALTVDTSRIRRMRISLLTVTTRQEEGSDGEFVTNGRPSVANRTAGPADSFQRRKFSASVMPRNML